MLTLTAPARRLYTAALMTDRPTDGHRSFCGRAGQYRPATTIAICGSHVIVQVFLLRQLSIKFFPVTLRFDVVKWHSGLSNMRMCRFVFSVVSKLLGAVAICASSMFPNIRDVTRSFSWRFIRHGSRQHSCLQSFGEGQNSAPWLVGPTLDEQVFYPPSVCLGF
jgi:hypothetical protein